MWWTHLRVPLSQIAAECDDNRNISFHQLILNLSSTTLHCQIVCFFTHFCLTLHVMTARHSDQTHAFVWVRLVSNLLRSPKIFSVHLSSSKLTDCETFVACREFIKTKEKSEFLPPAASNSCSHSNEMNYFFSIPFSFLFFFTKKVNVLWVQPNQKTRDWRPIVAQHTQRYLCLAKMPKQWE